MAIKIGFFTTDFTREPVVDEEQSYIQQKQIFVQGKKRLSYGGTYRTRGAMPAAELSNHGYDVVLAWQFHQEPNGRIDVCDMHGEWHRDLDIFWSQRWMSIDAPEQMRRARAYGMKTVADLDDGFMHLPKSNIAYHTTSPTTNTAFNREHYWRMLAEVDLVTVSTDALAADMERNNARSVAICKNAIDLAEWPQRDPGKDGMIGWTGGIEWRASDLPTLRPVLPQFLMDYGLPIYHGGDSDKPGVPKFWEQTGIDPSKVQCAVAKLCPIWEYPKLWDPINIALVPLERHPFNVRKSHLKGLEASAKGIPFIYSSHMPEYDSFGAGISADNSKPKTWRAALEYLLDPEVRREEGAFNRGIAEQWDIKIKWRQWDDAFRSILPNKISESGDAVNAPDSDRTLMEVR